MPIFAPRPPYTAGTVTLTNGSAIVTGSGTSWLANAYDGDLIVFMSPVTGMNMVASVQTNTSLTLAAPWTGATTSGVAYAVSNTQGQSAVNLTIARLQSLLTTLADVPTSAELAETVRIVAQTLSAPQQATARANIGFAALTLLSDAAFDARFPGRPKNGAGIGQIAAFNLADNTAVVLPAGGTWVSFALLGGTGGSVFSGSANITIAAGGTTVHAAIPSTRWAGFWWRIA